METEKQIVQKYGTTDDTLEFWRQRSKVYGLLNTFDTW